ncbi:MAG TPA: DUF1214 domain-containing protein [Acidimicrobiales bacterium]|nr:DUF1214 domain-containing protein [Acidimicrobiales bacterium]
MSSSRSQGSTGPTDRPQPTGTRKIERKAAAPLTATVFHEILDELLMLESRLALDDVPLDEVTILEGYKWIFSILSVGLDAYVWADKGRPRFVDIVGPNRKWGGDNADAFYQFAPIDPSRTYRVWGKRGDAAYLSLTVYGGPDDGRYSERIVGWLNDRDMRFGPDGSFELTLRPTKVEEQEPKETPANSSIVLEPDSVCAITRDYLIDPVNGRRAEWNIEAVDPPATRRDTDEELAKSFRAALTWLRDQAKIVPIPLGEPNTVDEPYPVPQQTFGWAAGDAAYAMGSFSLDHSEALVIKGRSPDCAFWNVCLWNQFLHTYDYSYERVTLNSGQVVYEPDGSWTIVIAVCDPGHPNWISTAGHLKGRIWFRWFLPAETPTKPSVQVVRIGDAIP